MKNIKKLLCLLLALTFTVALCACSGGEEEGETETLIMATNASFPPYEYVEGETIVGIDAEIAGALAEKLGMDLEIMDVEFGSIIAGVQSGKYDIGMAGMTVTEERKESVDFSITYATAVQVIIVPEDSTATSIDDLADKMVGVQQDTTGDIYLSASVEDGGIGSDHVTQYKTGNDAVQGLLAGKVDAVVIDNEPAKAYVAANEGLKILETSYVTEEYAIAVSKDNPELLEKINTALSELIEDGTVQTIVDKYIPAE